MTVGVSDALNDMLDNAFIKGEGENLLFLHGYLSSKKSFFKQTEYFSKYFRVIAPDLAGFSDVGMPYPYALNDYARDVRRLLDRFDGKTHFIAHSFGARVLFRLLPALPENKAGKLVLTGAAGIKPRFSLKKKLAVRSYKIRRKLGLDVSAFGSSDYRSLSAVMKKSFVKIVNERLEEKIRSVKNECLIISGDKDKETPPYTARRMHKLIKNSTLTTIVGAGHFAFIEKAGEFNVLVKEFLL